MKPKMLSIGANWKKVAIATFISTHALTGCATGSNPAMREEGGKLFVKWTEEVQLSDGRVIIAERSDGYERVSDSGSGLGRSGWLYRKGSFKATLPEPVSRTVSWEGTLQPLVLDILQGSEMYFVGRVAAGRDFDEWKIPWHKVNADPSIAYVVFQFTANGWKRLDLSELPLTAKPNLLASTRHFFERSKSLQPGVLVTLSQKVALDSNPLLAKELRMIVRPSPSGSK